MAGGQVLQQVAGQTSAGSCRLPGCAGF